MDRDRIKYEDIKTFEDYMRYRHEELKGYKTDKDEKKYRHIKEGWMNAQTHLMKQVYNLLDEYKYNKEYIEFVNEQSRKEAEHWNYKLDRLRWEIEIVIKNK